MQLFLSELTCLVTQAVGGQTVEKENHQQTVYPREDWREMYLPIFSFAGQFQFCWAISE